MNLHLNSELAARYNSTAQKIRVMTEAWAKDNLFCPYCGNDYIEHFVNNKPVADFYCPHCAEEYELKSKNSPIANKVMDGAYNTMIARIESINNPNFFFMQYSRRELSIRNLIVVPKHFFVPEIIEKRKPLSANARRAGWVGCNIILKNIPLDGLIYVVKDEKEQPVEAIINKIHRTNFIKQYKLDARGWILDVLNCINKIEKRDFSLGQVYAFESILAAKHPDNHHIRDKIRQQLQLLRDKGIIEFNGRGKYSKIP